MPMRVLHASFQRYWAPGIAQQVESEQAAARELSIPWTSRLYTVCPEGHRTETIVGPEHHRTNGAARKDYYAWLRAELNNYDLLVLRYIPAAIDQLLFCNSLRIPFYLVHHTLEGPELEAEPGVRNRVKLSLENVAAKAILQRCAGIVAVTSEIAEYERRRGLPPSAPAHIYPNGTLIEDGQVQPDHRNGDLPVLLFVASHFAPWHGLDRVLESARRCAQPFIMHLVGRLGDADLQSTRNDPRFVVHGVLDSAGISRLIQESWLGLSSFALERKSLTAACTLKVREYLAAGLPVYAGHGDVFDPDFKFYKTGPCDINLIVQAAMIAKGWSRDEVAYNARPYIDKRQLLLGLYRALIK